MSRAYLGLDFFLLEEVHDGFAGGEQLGVFEVLGEDLQVLRVCGGVALELERPHEDVEHFLVYFLGQVQVLLDRFEREFGHDPREHIVSDLHDGGAVSDLFHLFVDPVFLAFQHLFPSEHLFVALRLLVDLEDRLLDENPHEVARDLVGLSVGLA